MTPHAALQSEHHTHGTAPPILATSHAETAPTAPQDTQRRDSTHHLGDHTQQGTRDNPAKETTKREILFLLCPGNPHFQHCRGHLTAGLRAGAIATSIGGSMSSWGTLTTAGLTIGVVSSKTYKIRSKMSSSLIQNTHDSSRHIEDLLHVSNWEDPLPFHHFQGC